MYDVIIVGGGPAGSMAGYQLARNGVSCLILDRQKFPRQKPCGGAITRRTITLFPFLEPLMEFRNYKQIFHFKDQPEQIILDTEEPVAFLNNRLTLDYNLLKLAINNGCQVKEQINIVKFELSDEFITVISDKNEKFEAKFIIGADGVHSLIRRNSTLQKYWKNKTEAVVLVNDLPFKEDEIAKCNLEKSTVHLHVEFGNLEGYGWVFPRQDHINMGFGGHTKKYKASLLKTAYEDYLKFCQEKGILPKMDLPKAEGWVLQTNGPIKHFSENRMVLAGDAAGFVHPMTGEGIIYACWSGTIAADVITQYLKGQPDISQLHKLYHKKCMKEFGSDLKIIARFQGFALKQLGFFFKLAQNDPILYEFLKMVLPAEVPFKKLIPKIIWRAIIGIFKGNYKSKKMDDQQER